MRKTMFAVIVLFTALLLQSCTEKKQEQGAATEKPVAAKHTITVNTPDDAINELKEGNKRFLEGKMAVTDYDAQIKATADDQHPHSVILSCLDSRVPPEIIFDQGIGNLFVARVAGNVEDTNILGSMEFATKLKQTKLIVVLGHNHCGAVKGAIADAKLGNLTSLLEQIKPAITGDPADKDAMVDATAKKNVELTIADILKGSPVIAELVSQGSVKIVGAYYDLTTGKVEFMQ